jgi:hypothetical protein
MNTPNIHVYSDRESHNTQASDRKGAGATRQLLVSPRQKHTHYDVEELSRQVLSLKKERVALMEEMKKTKSVAIRAQQAEHKKTLEIQNLLLHGSQNATKGAAYIPHRLGRGRGGEVEGHTRILSNLRNHAISVETEVPFVLSLSLSLLLLLCDVFLFQILQ